MTSRRVQKVAQAIREVVSMAILAEVKDPRVCDVTVTYVEVSADLRQAKVHVSIMGDPKKQSLAMHGLQHAAGFLQSKVADRIDTRYTPRLQFVLDEGVKHSMEIERILRRVLPDAPRFQNEPAEGDEIVDVAFNQVPEGLDHVSDEADPPEDEADDVAAAEPSDINRDLPSRGGSSTNGPRGRGP